MCLQFTTENKVAEVPDDTEKACTTTPRWARRLTTSLYEKRSNALVRTLVCMQTPPGSQTNEIKDRTRAPLEKMFAPPHADTGKAPICTDKTPFLSYTPYSPNASALVTYALFAPIHTTRPATTILFLLTIFSLAPVLSRRLLVISAP